MSRLTSPATTSMPFGDAYAITFAVGTTASSGLCRNRFVTADSGDTTNKRPVNYPAAGANAKTVLGLIGGYRVQAPVTNAGSISLGTAADPYMPGEQVAVTIRGSDLVEAADLTATHLVFGDLISTDAAGKAVKWAAAPTVTPEMTAAFGDTDVSDLTISATWAVPATPTGAEVAAYVTEVLEEYTAAEAVKIKTYLAEYMGDYAGAGNAGYGSIIGVALGEPDEDGLVSFMFVGRA